MSNDRYPQRKSPRLRGYDYTQGGAYFVTICTHAMARWFGDCAGGIMVLNQIGQIAVDCWATIREHFEGVELDVAVVMPNHVHGIVVLASGAALGTVVGAYKAAVTRQARRECSAPPATIWHTRYHDHIVRNQRALERIREYILRNPARWRDDPGF